MVLPLLAMFALLFCWLAEFVAPMGPWANDRGLFRDHIVRACEASLKRLRTGYIDLYWCHEWDGMPLSKRRYA